LPERGSTDDIEAPLDAQLRTALQALPAKQQAAVIYHYLADLPYAEVGVLLETSEVAARRSAADGIANLRKNYSRGTRS
jgi:DNA-directed RNA polymerase specialized sigma24 family protein